MTRTTTALRNRLRHALAAFAGAAALLVAAVLPALAAPAPGTVITNTATSTGTGAGVATTSTSNPVQITVGTPALVNYSAVLTANNFREVNPGTFVDFPHTLTNNGLVSDSYTLAAVAGAGTFAYTSITLLPDANGDGVPDSLVPLAGAFTLAPGQALRFVVRAVVPASAAPGSQAAVTVSATAASNTAIAPNTDIARIFNTGPVDCALVTKMLSSERGPSPGGPVTVTLTYRSCAEPRSRLEMKDHLPAGMSYVAGSARFSEAPGVVLTDGVIGSDRQGAGPQQVAWNFGVSEAGTASATVYDIPANSGGNITFQVNINAGIAVDTVIPNFVTYAFYDAAGNKGYTVQSNTATYTVTGTIDLKLDGETIPVATPGTTVPFNNLLTNLGTLTETFNITLSASTFPPGTVMSLFKADGLTPLADTNGDGIPDTGPVAPGGSYKIVVKVTIPSTALPAQYSVLKTARSATAPARSASAVDQVNTLSKSCRVTLTPDNSGKTGYGRDITYTHFIANEGNCTETVVAPADWLTDSSADWRSEVFLDNPVAGPVSLPGVVDSSDTLVVPGWTTSLAPGQSIRFLVHVMAPPAPKSAAAKAAKDILASDTTRFSLDSSNSGRLRVTDVTVIDDKADEGVDNVILNYRNPNYTSPSIWAVIGGNLYLQANATACNADPTVVERRTVVLTGANGEREEFTAVETGPNTGIFVVAAVPARKPPVVAGDGIVEGNPNDSFDVELLGCGRRITTVVTLINPSGVVFDSANNLPVVSARVRLVSASAGQCTNSAVAVTPNPATTGVDGRFAFPSLPAGSYCLQVTPPNGYTFASKVPVTQLPSGRNIESTGPTSGGSYGGVFAIASPGGSVVFDVPVDPVALSGLFVQKAASRASAEVGEFVDYLVGVRNSTGLALDRAPVIVVDQLPSGFAYVPGTARRDGKPIADPAGGRGPTLSFDVGTLAAGAQVALSYRVRIGPGALQGDGVNRVNATHRVGSVLTESNTATATVVVQAGVFTDRGYILGKVFLDCNANRAQDAGEPGVPGIRLMLEDGTSALTDGDGKYSFYGILNRTHVLKLDKMTLPPGAVLGLTTFRNMGDSGSLFVDLKAGELQQADFAITTCDEDVRSDVRARRDIASQMVGEGDLMIGQRLATERVQISDPKALPASGTLGGAAVPGAAMGAGATSGLPGQQAAAVPGFTPVAPMPQFGMSQRGPEVPVSTQYSQPMANTGFAAPNLPSLESILPALDNALGFIDLKDGETLPYAQSTVRVKGLAGATFKLLANGVEVPQSRVGKRSQLPEKQVQAWEYIGVELKPGENTLELKALDSFGNPRGEVAIKVIVPDRLGKLTLEVPASTVADGRTPARVVVKLTDTKGVPVTSRTPVTLDASAGSWAVTDLDPREPGVQVMVENGRGEFKLLPPTEPGPIVIRAWSGQLKDEVKLDALPELRNMIAAGIVEGVINLRNLDPKALVPARKTDGFEQELQRLSWTWNDGKTEAAARLAFFLKGKVKGEYLLTAAYDSDKPTRERLFRDIQPDEFYPVYGDSALRAFDAQSTSPFYVRVDKDRSYLLYGDFNTQAYTDARKLSSYSRSITGGRWHYETDQVVANAFGAKDTSKQVIDEIRANGTSGPYSLSSTTALTNSEKVEIIVRDRNQSSLVLSATPQQRFYDYEFEPLTGRLLMKAPVPSVDANINPVFVRVTYEADQGGDSFWVAGGDVQFRLTNRIEVGASYAEDQNPTNPFKLIGVNATVRLGENTVLWAEAAQTDQLTSGKGTGERIEVKHEGERLKVQAFVARTDVEFNNPGAYMGQGRSEAGVRGSWQFSEDTMLRAEALHTGDLSNNSRRDGVLATVQHSLGNRMSLELGVRYAHDYGTGSPVPPVEGTPIPDTAKTPDQVTTVRARLTGAVPGYENVSLYGEGEVDVTDTSRHIVALGGEVMLPNRSRVYGRYEFMNSVTGPYGLANGQKQNASVLGVDTEYMQDGRLFSEYRIRDAFSGGDTEAAIGLRNLWNLGQGIRLGTSLEHVNAISGTGQNDNTAVALALEYTANPLWKGSTRLEFNDAVSTQTWLFTVGLAARLAPSWTMLARNTLSIQSNKSDDGEHTMERMQAGVAWRDIETNQFNALGRVEVRDEKDDATQGVQLRSSTTLVSLTGNWQPRPPFLVSGRYAAKWTTDKSLGLTTKYRAQLVGGRATWEFLPRWDIGIAASSLFGDSFSSKQYGVGVELGYMVTTNLWLSAGYNFFGFKDADLAGGDYTTKGPFVRLRYKFDEDLLSSIGGDVAQTAKARDAK